MKLYTYVVKHDTGLAPNPFGEWCSVAVCTPNHQGILATPGDWICGFSPKSFGNKLVYALQVEECPSLEQYFQDPRWAYKKPSRQSPEARCGDNFYERMPDGSWKQHWNFFHRTQENFDQDIRRPVAFVGRRFWYFGEHAVDAPREGLSVGGKGVRLTHQPGACERFVAWLDQTYPPGRHGMPLHYAQSGA